MFYISYILDIIYGSCPHISDTITIKIQHVALFKAVDDNTACQLFRFLASAFVFNTSK